MKERLKYTFNMKGTREGFPADHRRPGKHDPRVIALVKLMARQAAERDYKALLEVGTLSTTFRKTEKGPKL